MYSPVRSRRGLRSGGPAPEPAEVSDAEHKKRERKVFHKSESDSDYDDENKENKQKLNATVDGEDEIDSGKAKKIQRPKKQGPVQQRNDLPIKGRHQEQKKAGQQKKVSPQPPVLGVCLTCVMVVLIAVYLYDAMTAESRPIVSASDRLDAFLSKLDELKSKFPSQGDRFWSVVASAPMDHLNSYHGDKIAVDRPIVIMIVGQPGVGETTACIANHIAELYTKALAGSSHGIAPIISNGSDFMDADSDFTKQKLDLAFKRGFSGASKAAIVHDFDKLPACTALLFHSYCENDNAEYKDVAIILTVELNQQVTMVTKEVDRQVNVHLGRRWSGCPDFEERGKIEAMLSRVANNIALVSEEQSACSTN